MKRLLVCAISLLLGITTAAAQEKPKVRVASLTLPVVAPLVFNVMKEKKLDAKHGFDLEIRTYPSISAYYIGLAKGEVDALLAGPTVLQKMQLEGAPVQVAATAMRMSDLVIVTTNPAVKTFADLRGKQLAADMGSGQYQIVSIYSRAKNINLGSDITVLNANFALARGQLAAGRVDAAMVIDPIATVMLKENKDMRIIFNGADAWKEVSGNAGWELVLGINDEFSRKGKLPLQLIAALQDVAQATRSDMDGVDGIAVKALKLPAGVVKDSLASKRLVFEVQPAWQEERKTIVDIMNKAVQAGFVERLPNDNFFYSP